MKYTINLNPFHYPKLWELVKTKRNQLKSEVNEYYYETLDLAYLSKIYKIQSLTAHLKKYYGEKFVSIPHISPDKGEVKVKLKSTETKEQRAINIVYGELIRKMKDRLAVIFTKKFDHEYKGNSITFPFKDIVRMLNIYSDALFSLLGKDFGIKVITNLNDYSKYLVKTYGVNLLDHITIKGESTHENSNNC